MASELIVAPPDPAKLKQLRGELADALAELKAAEGALAAEQAAVNRFRMHCRLKIGTWVDDVLRQRAERQHILTKLRLMRHSAEIKSTFDEDDPYWEAYAEAFASEQSDDARVLLPTDVPNDKAAEKRLYRDLAKRFHPDLAVAGLQRTYATTMMAAVNEAFQSGDAVTLRNLAGEVDPTEMARYENGKSREERKLQKSLLGVKRRLRKVNEQFRAMKGENTAKLWRKAQTLDAKNVTWWEAVRGELEVESGLLAEQLGRLRVALEVYETNDG